MLNNKRNRKSKGFTLLEVLMVIAASAIIALMAFMITDKILSNHKSSSLAKGLLLMEKPLQDSIIYRDVRQLSLDEAKVVNDDAVIGVLPNNLKQYDSNGKEYPITPYSTKMNFFLTSLPIYTSSRGRYGFSVEMPNLSMDQCRDVVLSEVTKRFTQVKVGGSSINVLNSNSDGRSELIAFANLRCINTRNTVTVYLPIDNSVIIDDSTGETGVERGRDLPIMLGGVLPNTAFTGNRTCPANSTWSNSYNRCGCANGTRWQGQSCVSYTAANRPKELLNVCRMGYGYNKSTRSCGILPRSASPAAAGTDYDISNQGVVTIGLKELPDRYNKVIDSNGVQGVGLLKYNPSDKAIKFTHEIGATQEVIGGRIINIPAVDAGMDISTQCIVGVSVGNRCVTGQ